MFDSAVTELDAAACATLVAGAQRVVVEQECILFQLAAHWADLHDPAAVPTPDRSPGGGERSLRLGGEGTPEVREFSTAEFGTRQETTTGAARAMIADALDTRHRLPNLWGRVLRGPARVWRVRKVAQATRHLSLVAARLVDRAVAGSIVSLPWTRFETLLEARIIEADPAMAEERARAWEAERFVRAGASGPTGLKLLVARAEAGDVIWFMATVNRIAEILAEQGSLDSADVRRARAIGILARPAEACVLLWNHREADTDPADARSMDEQRREDELADTHVSLQPIAPMPDAPVAELARRLDQRWCCTSI